MGHRFTIAALLLWVTFVALVLAIVVPLWRVIQQEGDPDDLVVAVAASADGSTFGALLDGDNEEIRAEAVWALEWISGCVLGRSAANWRSWWERLAVCNVSLG